MHVLQPLGRMWLKKKIARKQQQKRHTTRITQNSLRTRQQWNEPEGGLSAVHPAAWINREAAMTPVLQCSNSKLWVKAAAAAASEVTVCAGSAERIKGPHENNSRGGWGSRHDTQQGECVCVCGPAQQSDVNKHSRSTFLFKERSPVDDSQNGLSMTH